MIETQGKEQGTCAVSGGPVAQDLISKVPSPEVLERAKRRTYPAEYKRAMLREVDSLRDPGSLGALLRREGLYASHIATWRWQRERGELDALTPKKRGPRSTKNDPLLKRIAALERENRRLQKRLERAELINDIQKKISEITGIPLKDLEHEGDD